MTKHSTSTNNDPQENTMSTHVPATTTSNVVAEGVISWARYDGEGVIWVMEQTITNINGYTRWQLVDDSGYTYLLDDCMDYEGDMRLTILHECGASTHLHIGWQWLTVQSDGSTRQAHDGRAAQCQAIQQYCLAKLA